MLLFYLDKHLPPGLNLRSTGVGCQDTVVRGAGLYSPSLGGPPPALCGPTEGVLCMCARAHECVPISLTCPSSVCLTPGHIYTHPAAVSPRGKQMEESGTHRPGANSGLHGLEMTLIGQDAGPAPRSETPPTEGRGPRRQHRCSFPLGSPTGQPQGGKPAPPSVEDGGLCSDRCALLLKGRDAPPGSWDRPGCRCPSDPGSRRQDSQFCPRRSRYGFRRLLGDPWSFGESTKKMVDKAIKCHHPCPALGGFQRPGKEKASSSATPRRPLGLGASMCSAAPTTHNLRPGPPPRPPWALTSSQDWLVDIHEVWVSLA